MSDVSKFNIGGSDINVKDATARTAVGTTYSNTTSGMTASDVQDAIDELHTSIAGFSTLTYNSSTETITVS